jgi:hypothetical protein
MSDPLSSSRQKFARADKHFVDLQKEISEFSQQNPYEQVTEPRYRKGLEVRTSGCRSISSVLAQGDGGFSRMSVGRLVPKLNPVPSRKF